jgi:choline dehydrogenase-like flavoprotein
VLRPKSIGALQLTRDGQIAIDFNFLADPYDASVLVEGIKVARNILAQPEFAALRGEEMLPGEHIQTDEQLHQYVREYCATVFHPVGTCKMGRDEMSVVAPEPSKCMAWKICAWLTHQSCHRLSAATPMPLQ